MYQSISYGLAQSHVADMRSQATRQALARTARKARRTPAQDGRNPVTRVLAQRLRALAPARTA